MNGILEAAMELENELVKNRRHIHSNPEIGLELEKTTAYVIQQLEEMGIEPKLISKSAITAKIGQGGKTILLRADMDALPMEENAELSFKSCNHYAHLCGHDMHTATLLGVAKVLKAREAELKGTVLLMFQPGEEIGQGAKSMLDAGLLTDNKVDAAMALHVSAEIEPGKMEYKQGVGSASMDTFLVKIQGKGAHSSTPHLGIDPLMIVNTLYTMLNSLVGREADPFQTAVLTIGKMGGGTAANIIPDTAVLEGGLRCFDKETRNHLSKRIYEIIDEVVRTMRGSYTIQKFYTPSIYNDPVLCNAMTPYIEEIIGKENFTLSDKPLSGTEDFSYISEEVPSMYMWLGAGNKDNYPLHNPNVVFDEKALPIGVAVLANCAMNWLKDNATNEEEVGNE
ncbi:MAG: amidohydrolase [Candidatus Cellulosilyticum pullistercoris]|uniref:Amidohydrolase n=1 Tax=Candidatus Cellulosilyticum pullistercoris TaxID=2838521 RepID=A0A9E2NK67_9FIRM|nr:amidohydrolase [Candidatus Cellulosilyticum pullistercoris]